MTQFLSPRDLAKAVGASESSLKRWVDEGLITASRTAGGHRRIALSEAVRFVRSGQTSLVHPEILGVPDLDAWDGDAPKRSEDQSATLIDLLKAGHDRAARSFVLQLYLGGESIAAICDGPISAAMHTLGELWLTNENGIFVEHRATDICLGIMNQLRTLIDVKDNAPRAVGGAPTGDPYMLPSIMAAATLDDIGYRAINLGPETPGDSLVHAAVDAQATIAWISISSVRNRAALEQSIATTAEKLSEHNIPLAVGGRECHRLSLDDSPNVFVGRSMRELSGYAAALKTGARDHDPTLN